MSRTAAYLLFLAIGIGSSVTEVRPLSAQAVPVADSSPAQAPPGKLDKSDGLRVASDFDGGSGRVLSLDPDQQIVRLAPADHAQRGWTCWWYVRLENVRPDQPLTIDIGDAPWTTPDRAAWSVDGKVWQQTPAGEREGKRIRYTWTPGSQTVYVAWGPPYTSADAVRAIENAVAECPAAEAFELTKTRQGRSVAAIRFKPPAAPADAAPADANDSLPYGIWIQARQHAWESGSSWVCHGLLQWLASDEPAAGRLRESAVVTIVPIMDIDNVTIGAGGKNQTPHDHNRDWSDQPHWYSVRAAMADLRRQNEAERFDLFVDLHNPGASAKRPYFYIAPRELLSPRGQRNLDRFLAASREEIVGPLTFTGETEESGAKYDPQWKAISKNWVTTNTRDHVVALTLETAWNTPHSTSDGYQTVGRQLGMAIERYLRSHPRLP